jgi:WD40 repeat protein
MTSRVPELGEAISSHKADGFLLLALLPFGIFLWRIFMCSRSVYAVLAASVVLSGWNAWASPAVGTAKPLHNDAHGDALPHAAILRIGTVRLHHGDFVNHVAFTPDGKTVVSCSDDGTLRSWEASTGKEIHCFRGHRRSVMSLSISKDGKTLASISQDFTIRLWDLAAGKELRKLDAPRGAYYDLSFSPDGLILASCGQNLTIWKTQTHEVIREFELKIRGWLTTLAFSPDGKTLAVGSQDGIIRFWDTVDWKKIRQVQAHAQGVHSLAFSPNGRFLASAGEDGLLSLRNAATGKEVHSLCKRGPRGCSRLAFSPDSKLVAWTWGAEGAIRLFEVATGSEVRQFKVFRYGIASVAFSPDGKTLASASESTVRLWNVETAKVILPFLHPQTPIASLDFCANDKILAGVPWGTTIYCWDSITGKVLHPLGGHSAWLCFAAASPDGQTLFSGDRDGFLRRWDVAKGKEVHCFRVNKECAPMAVSPDGKMLAAPHTGQQAGRLYDMESGKEVGRFGSAINVLFLPDGKGLILHVPGQGLVLWDIKTAKQVWALPGQTRGTQCLAVSPDGKTLAAGTTDKLVLRWDMSTNQQLTPLDGEQKCVYSVAFSPDGRTLASGGQDGTIHLWEMRTGRRRVLLEGHKGDVSTLTFSRDGRRLASGSKDTTVLVWDLTDGLALSPPKDFTAEQLEAFWRVLGSDDAAKAYRGIWRLATAPAATIPFLRARLRPVPIVDTKRARQLIADLDDDDFRVRTKAQRELESLGESVAAALRSAAKNPPSPEAERRIKSLLDKIHEQRSRLSAERICMLRALEVLEQIGTPEASRILSDLADGAAEAQLTEEAKASLERLAKQRKRSR